MNMRVWLAAIAAGLGVTFGAAATVAPVAPDTPATLNVEYEFVSAGNDGSAGLEWNVRRTVTVEAALAALAPAGQAGLKPAGAEQQRQVAAQQQQAARAAENMQPLMQDAMAIYQRCGEDESCIEREVQRLGFGMEMTPELESAQRDVAALTAEQPARYQAWVAKKESRRYVLSEERLLRDGDPICYDRPNKTCTIKSSAQGSGEMPGDGDGGTSSIEVDLAGSTMTLRLPPIYGALAAVEVVASDKPGRDSGTNHVLRRFSADIETFTVPVGDSLSQLAGERTIPVRDDATGQAGTLTARWRFATR